MTKKKWTLIEWFGLPSMRYLFLVLPNGQRVIVDHWYSLRVLHYIPFIRRYQKFDAYFIPNDIDISEWDNLLVSQYDMAWATAKASGRIFLVKLLGGGAIAGIMFSVLITIATPFAEMCKYLNIPIALISILISLGFLILINVISKKNIEKKIPLKNFEFHKKIIQMKLKDPFMTFGQWTLVIFAVVSLIIPFYEQYVEGFVYTTFTIFFTLLFYTGILRTADMYIKYEEKENEKRE